MTITPGYPPNGVGLTYSFGTKIEPTPAMIAEWFGSLSHHHPTGEVWVRRDELQAWTVTFGLEVRQ